MAHKMSVDLYFTESQLQTVKDANLNIPEICVHAVRQAIADWYDMQDACTLTIKKKPRPGQPVPAIIREHR